MREVRTVRDLRRLRRLRRAFVLTVVGLAGCDQRASEGDSPAEVDGAIDTTMDESGGETSGETDSAKDGRIFEASPTTTLDAVAPKPETLDPNEGTVGDPCLDDVICDPAHTGDNICTEHGFSIFGSLYPSPMCVGRECDPGPLGARPLPCDGGRGTCVGDGALVGSCLPGCTFDDTSAARGCPKGTACSGSFVERDSAGVTHGLGWCAPACVIDSDCTRSGEHCLVDEGICIAIPITRTLTLGVRCDAYSNPPEVECNCLHDQGTGTGFCTTLCSIGDSTRGCPSGYVCSTGVTRAFFSTEPPGVITHCLPTCVDDTACAPFSGHCADTVSGKACLPGAAP